MDQLRMDFNGKVAVVTGGASGIGLACCQEFAERGAAVAVVDVDVKAGGRVAEDLRRQGARSEFVRVDVSQRAQVEQGIAEIVARLGGIDILVNNAGIQRYATATTCTEEEWDEVLAINLKGAFLMTKHAIPEIVRRGGGAIVMTGSVQSATAQRNSVHYVVSKHALVGLTRSVALDYAKQNIRANLVMPGAIDTPLLRGAIALDPHPERVREACDRLHMRGKMGKPEEVAHVIVFLASDLASFMTGASVAVDGGLLVPAGGMAFQETGTGAVKA